MAACSQYIRVHVGLWAYAKMSEPLTPLLAVVRSRGCGSWHPFSYVR